MKLVEDVVEMHDDYAEDDIADWNDDDYVDGHDDCLEEDKGDDNDISDYNHMDGSIEHATAIVLEDV
ncbi:Uncharacterized protein TCM_001649 [Theobroma cacao]|uniref:Uncharacterized protein n=1 Tax=Theobroma cacao TaxID=3641 RepID=A0A061DK59_THECC|nr:Uncharacterized protein TCM_001649 [Theobroma cacao]